MNQEEKVEITLEKVTAAIEAILFAAGHPIEYAKLSEVLGLSVKDVKNMVEVMSEEYNSENSKRGLLLLMYPESCQLATKEEFLPYIREALGIKRGGNLSASTLEALAVVAYNQPVTRAFVDAVRGVDSSYAMTSLIDKGLIESLSRLDAPGRPMLYTTTEKFLRVFGLSSLDDLPETELTPAPAEEALAVEEVGFSSALAVAESSENEEANNQ
ncbi:MAG: SMC-Scp complex subunit ScpB [Ruminococcaceae bacterium]|nr:SMC-Scp complex subunit ScpB [Oscillospiraceae bacterium]